MNVGGKSEHDPIVDLDMPNSYMRWALDAIKEVAGENGLTIILRKAGLEALRYNPPPDNDDFDGLTAVQYSNLTIAVLDFFGRAAQSMAMRVGRVSARRGIERQAQLFNVTALTALKMMPLDVQFKVGLSQMQDGIRQLWAGHGQRTVLRVKETPDAWLYINETCPECAGKTADAPLCWLFVGVLRETTHWFTGKEFEVVEIECRAMGAPACVWRISKTPQE